MAKRADGRYELKVRISGPGEPRRYKAVYGSTLREVKQKAAEVKSTLHETENRVQNYTVKDAIDYWLKQKERTARPQTMRNYRGALRFPLEKMGGKIVTDITVDDARQLHDDVARYSIVQANRMAARMKSVYRDLIARGLCRENPWTAITYYKHEPAEKRALTAQELEAIGKADLIPKDRAFISVLRYTGMRRGEALALDVEDIDFASGYVNISATVFNGQIGPTKTKSSVRKVPMPDALAECLEEYVRLYHPGEGLLFPSRVGTPISEKGYRLTWLRISRAIFGDAVPKDFTSHIFRHTYASELVKNRIPPTTAMLLLGHRSLSTTMDVYTHLGWQDIDAAAVTKIFCGKSSSKNSSK